MGHLTSKQLNKKITDAEKKVKPGDIYVHYKDSSHQYQIHALCLIEAIDEVGVIYKPLYDGSTKVLWMRPISNFLEKIDVDSKTVKRFRKI